MKQIIYVVTVLLTELKQKFNTLFSDFFSHVINVKDAKDFSKDQDPVHGVLKGENRKLKAGLCLAELMIIHVHMYLFSLLYWTCLQVSLFIIIKELMSSFFCRGQNFPKIFFFFCFNTWGLHDDLSHTKPPWKSSIYW